MLCLLALLDLWGLPKKELFVTKEEKIGKLDDLEEIVYEYTHGSAHQDYLQQLDGLWTKCCNANSSDTTIAIPDAMAGDRAARGMELRFLPHAISSVL